MEQSVLDLSELKILPNIERCTSRVQLERM